MKSGRKLMFYSQHVLGMGHLVRSLEILRGLEGFDVRFMNGGEMVAGLDMPSFVDVVQLPPMKTDADFRMIDDAAEGGLQEIRMQRRRILLEEFERFRPDVLVIELFPFGRKQFGYELMPLLARNRLGGRRTKVVCSLRDILVKKSDEGSSAVRAVTLMNRYFDLLLIHADPEFQNLQETFSHTEDLKVPVKYTGYVVQSNIEDLDDTTFVRSAPDEKLILASIGGGRVGYELLAATVEASKLLAARLPHRLLMFTGPYMSDDDFRRLEDASAAQPHIMVRRFTGNFLAYMCEADLSISMAGYNTCMNILMIGVPSLVLPFAGHGNNEQAVRAAKLASRGVLTVLDEQDLQAEQLAVIMSRAVQERRCAPPVINIHGVRNTADAIADIVESGRRSDRGGIGCGRDGLRNIIQQRIAPHLERCQQEDRQIDVFLRDDDIDEDEDTLRELLDICFARAVPINLEVIPGKLTDAGIALLKTYKGFDPSLLELNQHGWRHVNHETAGKKCEFGASRSYEQQYDDIAMGKARLLDVFDDRFFPAFTPPWNRCTSATFKALDALGFAVLSKDRGKQTVSGYGFQEISVTLDLFRWKGGALMRPPEEILDALAGQMQRPDAIGIMSHHKVMDAEAFTFLDELLQALSKSPAIRFHTFESLLQATRPAAHA